MSTTLITNVNGFDGKNEELIDNANMLVKGNKIKQVSTKKTDTAGAAVVNGGVWTLTPGFIGAQEHLIGQMPFNHAMIEDNCYLGHVADWPAGVYLKNGFTTVRDAAGNTYSLKRAIDCGEIDGPRIYPSHAIITQTGGRAKHRTHGHGPLLGG